MSAEVRTVLAEKVIPGGDACTIQEVSQKKLPYLEARRIAGILQQCITQTQIAATLPVINLDSLPDDLDKELSAALRAHQLLSERLETLQGLEQESDGAAVGKVEESKVRARVQLERDLKLSVRDLLRLFRSHSDAFFNVKTALAVEIGENEYTLIRNLQRFHQFMIEKLNTSLDEELQVVFCKQTLPSPAHVLQQMKLEEEMTAAIKQLDTQISQKNAEIKNLEKGLQERTKKEADLSLRTDKEHQSHNKTSKIKQDSIQQEINQLNLQLDKLIIENREAERALQQKNENARAEIEYLLQQFDNDIEKHQADLEIQEINCAEAEDELMKMEEAYAVLEEEYNQIQERRRLAEEKRKEEMGELELKTKAAIFAQAWWRGYSTRKALRNKAKSKKAKKGKGKERKKKY